MNQALPPHSLPAELAGPRYEDDVHGWALRQAELLRTGRLSEADTAHIADELIDVAGAQYDKLESALRVLLAHMLKWDHQPEHRSRSWTLTICEQRRRIQRVIKKNPSLKPVCEEAIMDGYEDAYYLALRETGLPESTFPPECPYDFTAILERPFTLDD